MGPLINIDNHMILKAMPNTDVEALWPPLIKQARCTCSMNGIHFLHNYRIRIFSDICFILLVF